MYYNKIVTIPASVLEEFAQVCSWHKSLCNMIRTESNLYDLHPDQGSFDYLENRAEALRLLAEQVLCGEVNYEKSV
jgi:hypothetical protein